VVEVVVLRIIMVLLRQASVEGIQRDVRAIQVYSLSDAIAQASLPACRATCDPDKQWL